MKKLYRSRTNKTITGLLGGIGESLSINPIIIRLIFILLVIVTHVWPAILIYIMGYLIVPLRPDAPVVHEEKSDS
jgi:phage shock protein C